MKSYEIVGWARDGELLCPDCAKKQADHGAVDGDPVFADQCGPTDYCSPCLMSWMMDSGKGGKAPDWVYLLGKRPAEGGEGESAR